MIVTAVALACVFVIAVLTTCVCVDDARQHDRANRVPMQVFTLQSENKTTFHGETFFSDMADEVHKLCEQNFEFPSLQAHLPQGPWQMCM